MSKSHVIPCSHADCRVQASYKIAALERWPIRRTEDVRFRVLRTYWGGLPRFGTASARVRSVAERIDRGAGNLSL